MDRMERADFARVALDLVSAPGSLHYPGEVDSAER